MVAYGHPGALAWTHKGVMMAIPLHPTDAMPHAKRRRGSSALAGTPVRVTRVVARYGPRHRTVLRLSRLNTTVQRSVQQYLTAVDTVVQQSQGRLRVGQKIPAGPETSNRKEAGSATLANSRRATTRVKASAAATAIISGQTATRWSCLTRAETRSSSRTSHKTKVFRRC
jgi:hypothetical protein